MADDPLVSILIPCYNASAYLRQCVRSALDQTYPHKEIIVVDDGSTDDSLEILRSFGSAIQVETGPNRGGNPTRNRLTELARGDWLQYLDADNYLLPDKVRSQMAFVRKHPEVDVVYSPLIVHNPVSDSQRQININPQDDPIGHYFSWSAYDTSALLWRQKAVREVGQWKPDQPCCQEHELLLRLLLAGKTFGLLDQPGAVYRQHESDSVSRKTPLRTIHQRFELTNRLEDHLLTQGRMTDRYRAILNDARFGIARRAYEADAALAKTILERIRKSGSRFVARGHAAPRLYKICYALLGFEGAEWVALLQRRLRRMGGLG